HTDIERKMDYRHHCVTAHPTRAPACLLSRAPRLSPAAPAVAAERAARPNHPVTRDDNRYLVLAVDAADGANGAGRADAARHVGVGPGLAVGNLAQRFPRGHLEHGAALLQR